MECHFLLSFTSSGPRGSLGQLYAKRLLLPAEKCSFDINAPLLGVHRSRNRDQKYSGLEQDFIFR